MPARFAGFAAVALVAACANSDRRAEPPRTPAPLDSAAVVRADLSRIVGDSAAPVWVVIISDFQCPYCKVWHDSTYPALRAEFVDRGRARLAYLHMPLPQHQHAGIAAELAMCAGEQGRFWEMHDVIFATQPEWTSLPIGTDYFRSLARRVAVDTARIHQCLDSGSMRKLVAADYQRAVDARARSTPSFFVGDSLIVGVQPIAQFRVAIANALRKRATGGPGVR